jgi:phage/plasmid-associated DNA primase
MNDADLNLGDLQEIVEVDDLVEQHNDMRNAAFFAKRARGKLLYSYVARSWFVFDEKHWRADDDGSAVRFAKGIVREMQRLADAVKDEDKRRKAMRYAIESGSRRRIEGMLALAQSDLSIVPTAFNTDPMLFNVRDTGLTHAGTATARCR